MGRWGFKLLQGDADLDEIDGLSSEFQVDLDCRGDWSRNDNEGERDEKEMTREQALAKLNNGVLDEAFTRFGTDSVGDLYSLFLFATKAMEIGAHFSKAQLSLLKQRLPIANRKQVFYPDGIKQLLTALAEYPNDGTRYDFHSPGLIETANMTAATEGPMGLNVCSPLSDRSNTALLDPSHWANKERASMANTKTSSTADDPLHANKKATLAEATKVDDRSLKKAAKKWLENM